MFTPVSCPQSDCFSSLFPLTAWNPFTTLWLLHDRSTLHPLHTSTPYTLTFKQQQSSSHWQERTYLLISLGLTTLAIQDQEVDKGIICDILFSDQIYDVA